MPAKRTAVNLRDLLSRQIDAEAAKEIKEIKNDPKQNTPVFSDADKVDINDVDGYVLKELYNRVNVDKHGFGLFCSSNPETREMQLIGMFSDHADIPITARFDAGKLILVAEKDDLAGLATKVHGNLHVTVDDPVFVDEPVTLVFDIVGKDLNKAKHYGVVVGEATKDLSGEVSDISIVQLAINRAAALITMMLTRAA